MSDNVITPPAGSNSTVNNDLVLTPGGYRPRSMVYKIKPEHHLADKDHRLYMVDSVTGQEVQELGPTAGQAPFFKPHLPRELSLLQPPSVQQSPGQRDGWVAYAIWTNTKIPAINQFTAQWTVPDEPKTKGNQTIFLFIGMQNSQFILQPVLQWGVSAAGGGDFWSICNWYTDGTVASTVHTDLVPVKPGQVLNANIALLNQQDRSFTYAASFENGPGLTLEKEDVIELLYANVVLESYGVADPDEYPPNGSADIQNVSLFINGLRTNPAWQLEPDNPGAGNNNGNGGPFITIPPVPGDRIKLAFGH